MKPSHPGAAHACRVVRGPLLHPARRAASASVAITADSFAQRGGEVVPNAPETGMHAESATEHRRRHAGAARSEEHTSELQSLAYLVCRLLLEKKKKDTEP